jgi:hypothetical protein
VHRGQRQSTSSGAILLGILFPLSGCCESTRYGPFELVPSELSAIGGVALTLAGTLPVEERYSQPWTSALDWLIKSGRFIFAIALVVFWP